MSANIKYNTSYNANAALQCLIIEDVLLVIISTIFQILYAFLLGICWSMSFVQIWNANNIFVNVLSPNFYHYEENVSREKESRVPKMLSCPSKIDWFVYKKRIRNGLV